MKIFKSQKFLILTGGLIFIVALVVGGFVFFGKKSVNVDIVDDPPWFQPVVLEDVKPGTKVTWHLKSPAVHPVMSLETPTGTPEIHSGHFTDTFSYTFDKLGIYVYICPIHPYMKGVVGVGQKVPKEKIPAWADWPPDYKEPPAGTPEIPGKGKIWLGAQFHKPSGKEKPGTLIVIDASNWKIEKIIEDKTLNNPHNLWEVDEKIVVANWFDLYISVFDKITGSLEKHVWVGESPAHVHAHGTDKLYVTLQGDDGVAILDKNFEVLTKIRAPKGPHGHWMSADGKRMSLASTEKGMVTVWDTDTDKKILEESVGEEMIGHDQDAHTHSLPLMAGITLDGKNAFTATSNTGKFYVFDIDNNKLVKSIDIGSVPIQTVPSPDGKYVLVPLTGSGEVVVISTKDWGIVKKIPGAGFGAHGVYFGEKQDDGWYAYVSSKFATWVTVIEMDKLEIAGYIPLPKDAWGGQGILVVK